MTAFEAEPVVAMLSTRAWVSVVVADPIAAHRHLSLYVSRTEKGPGRGEDRGERTAHMDTCAVSLGLANCGKALVIVVIVVIVSEGEVVVAMVECAGRRGAGCDAGACVYSTREVVP